VSAVERLDAIDARANGATAGPWARSMTGINEVVAGLRPVVRTDASRDADFIAEARQDVPVMATALRAILALHTPVAQRVGPPVCGGCSNDLHSTLHPCATRQIIETELTR